MPYPVDAALDPEVTLGRWRCSRRQVLAGILMIGALGLPVSTFSQATTGNPAIVQTTLNPLSASVLMEYTRPVSLGPSFPNYGGGGSASACGDLDGDGRLEVVIVDAGVILGGSLGVTRGDTFVISNISLGNGEAYGDITPLPAPYFEDKAEYAGEACVVGVVPCGDPLSVWSTAFFDFRARTALSTGPNGTNPALQGAPGFSEYFYLTEYPDVAAAVTGGQYASGLAHYLAIGRNRGYEAFAPNATIRGSDEVDTLTLNGPRGNFSLARIGGGYQVKDDVGRYGTLKVLGVERVRFSDVLIGLAGGAIDAFATIAGPLSSQSIDLTVNPGSPGVCAANQVWVVAILPGGGMFFLSPSGWGADLVAWGPASGPVHIPLVQSMNLTGFQGTEIYVAYGCDVGEVLAHQRYARVHVIE